MDRDTDWMTNRMVVGKMMQDHYEENPPDVNEWCRALEGCAKLYTIAAEHLRADPPRFREAAQAIAPAVTTGNETHSQIAMAYALSGQATDDFMNMARRGLSRDRDTTGG